MSGKPTQERRYGIVERVLEVQKKIGRELMKHVTKEEVMQSLEEKDKIHPAITKLVWERLAQENEDFFRPYVVRLTIKRQISYFNELLKLYADTLCNASKNGLGSQPLSFGSFTVNEDLGNSCFNTNTSTGILNNVPLGGHHGDPIMHSTNEDEFCPQPLNSVPSQNCSDIALFDPEGFADLWDDPTLPLAEHSVPNFSGHEHNGMFGNSDDSTFLLFQEYNIHGYPENGSNEGVSGGGSFGQVDKKSIAAFRSIG